MGSAGFYPEERPVHRVSVDGFWMDTRPVPLRDPSTGIGADAHAGALHDPPAVAAGAGPGRPARGPRAAAADGLGTVAPALTFTRTTGGGSGAPEVTQMSSSHTAVVPFGEWFGVPSGQTVAMKPSSASTTRRMSSVRIPMDLPVSFGFRPCRWAGPHLRGDLDCRRVNPGCLPRRRGMAGQEARRMSLRAGIWGIAGSSGPAAVMARRGP